MEIIILIIIIILVVRHFRKKSKKAAAEKPVQVVSIGDPSKLPNTLAELRKMRDAGNDEVRYQCSRKICELGIQLYREGKIINDKGSEYDVSTLLGELYRLIIDSRTCDNLPMDEALVFRCLEAGAEMNEKLNPPMEGDVFSFTNYSWTALASFYAEGAVCPRNAAKARKYYRMRIVYESRMKKMDTESILNLMEVPQAGEDGRQEILKFIALLYGFDALKIQSGEIARNFNAQTLQQAAELLFRMDWGRIGGNDIDAMLDEYRKGAEAGNAYAQYKLGNFYLKGRYVPKDKAQGMALMEKAAEQDLYLAVDIVFNHYYWLANPYAGDYGGASKQQIKEWKAAYDKWASASDRVLAMVERNYANSFTEYIRNSGDLPTRGSGKAVAESEPETAAATEEEHRGRLGMTDSESPFTILDLPDVITGPYNVTYRKTSASASSVDYWGDNGESTTIHVSDIGMTGQSAKNSDGYFYW